MDESVDSLLKSIYYAKKSNESGGFLSLNGLYHVAKLKIPNLKYKDVVNWLNKQKVYVERKELPKRTKIKGRSQRYFHVNRPKKELVVDTAFLQRYKTPWKYMIIGVDALSSRLYTGFLRKLSSEGAAKIVEKWIKNEPRWKIVYTDNGSEFKSVKFNDMLQKYDIKHLYSSPMFTNKSSLAEIYIRRFRETLAKVLASGKSKNKLQAYKVTTEIINSNPKTSLGMLTPSEAEKSPGKALFNKQFERWKKQDKLGRPKEPRFKEKENVYLRYIDPKTIKSHKSGDPVIDKKNTYVIQEVIHTVPRASYKLRQVKFPYLVLPNSFPEYMLIGKKDL